MKEFLNFILGAITDAKGRIEPKNIIGYLIIGVGIFRLVTSWDVASFSAIVGVGGGFLITSTIADNNIDTMPGQKNGS